MSIVPDPDRKPRDDEIDVYGLTHPGKVREENQDHFLLAQLSKQINVRLTSLPDEDLNWAGAERLAVLGMVADGVGGGLAGEAASRMTLAGVTRYVSELIDAYYTGDSADSDAFVGALEGAAQRVHIDLLAAGESDPNHEGMATTLTLWIGRWPYIYLLQVGDSRYYQLRGDELVQISRDQTIRQDLVDEGVIRGDQAAKLRWADALSSSLGGGESKPVVQRMDHGWNIIHMICSDGLTKHVPDEKIRDRLREMTSAKQVCEALLQDALDDGGSDNITLIVGRPLRRDLPE